MMINGFAENTLGRLGLMPHVGLDLGLLVLLVIVAVALLVLYIVFKAILLALPAIIIAFITWLILRDYRITVLVFVIVLVITLIKKL